MTRKEKTKAVYISAALGLVAIALTGFFFLKSSRIEVEVLEPEVKTIAAIDFEKNTEKRMTDQIVEARSSGDFDVTLNKLDQYHAAVVKSDAVVFFNDVKAFNDARAQVKAKGDALNRAVGWLQHAGLRKQIERKLEQLAPRIQEAAASSPGGCTLVRVNVYESFPIGQGLGQTPFKYVGEITILGAGEDAVDAYGWEIVNQEGGTISEGPKKGYRLDRNQSKFMCFGVQEGQLVSTNISFEQMGNSYQQAADAAKKHKQEIIDKVKKEIEEENKKKQQALDDAKKAEEQAAEDAAKKQKTKEAIEKIKKQIETVQRIAKEMSSRETVMKGRQAGEGRDRKDRVYKDTSKDHVDHDFSDEPMIIRAGER